MAEPETQGGKLLTLSEISQKSGISMPTLQRYKKLYQERLPSVGEGRKQRYPESALPVFDQIKTENAGKRGRPRKDASAPRPERAAASKRRGGRRAAKPAAKPAGRRGRRAAAPVSAAPAAAATTTGRRRGRPPGSAKKAAGRGRPRQSGGLLTLTEISKTTGISYPTLVRYVRLYADRLPHEGKGRARRFYSQAVDVFRQLRSESGRGGRKKSSGGTKRAATGRRGRPPAAAAEPSGMIAKRLKALEKTQESLEKKLRSFVASVQKLFR